MNAETLGLVRGITTVLAMLAFIGVVLWAWSRGRASRFDAAARLPLEEDPETHVAPQRAVGSIESKRLEK
jgi:cytochrome c oxidase cbb3-type subunit 4